MPPEMDGQDLLHNLAYECEGRFNQLLEVSHRTNLEVATIELCTEFQQRFAIWTAYLGVFARKSQCLDTRLRNLPDLQDLAARLLDILNRSLQHCISEMNSPRKKRRILESDNKHTAGVTPEIPQTQISALGTVDDVITRLMRLGTTIRQSSSSKIDLRAEKFFPGRKMDSFACLCAIGVQALYPDASQPLKDYLINSMLRRYARMQFASSRWETIGDRRVDLPTIEEVPSSETATDEHLNMLTKAIMASAVPHNPGAPEVISVSDLISVDIRPTSGWLRLPDKASTQLHKTSSIQVKQGNYPHMPGTERGIHIIPCQWCGEPLNKKQLAETDWRRHVDRDLKPYICLSEECSDMHSAFSTFDQWCRHMELHDWRWHQRVYLATTWECTLCDFDQKTYNNPETLYSHLTESHSNSFTGEQLHTISRQSKIEQPRSWDDCPLCGFTIKEQNDKDKPNVSERQKEKQKQEIVEISGEILEMINPGHHNSDLDVSDASDDSDDSVDADSHQQKRQIKDPSNEIARHIATHLQLLMLLTLRFADLQSYYIHDIFPDGDIKSNSADIDEKHSAASDGLSDLGNIIEEDEDGENNKESPMNLLVDTEKVISMTSSDFRLALEEHGHPGVISDNMSDSIANWLPNVITSETGTNKGGDLIANNDDASPQGEPEDPTPPNSRERSVEDDEHDYLSGKNEDVPTSWRTRKRRIGQPLLNKEEMMANPHMSGIDERKVSRAIETQDLVLIKRLLEDNVGNLEVINEFGITPLWYAVLLGRRDVIQFLLDAGANSEAENFRGQTVLAWAVANDKSDIIEMLGYT